MDITTICITLINVTVVTESGGEVTVSYITYHIMTGGIRALVVIVVVLSSLDVDVAACQQLSSA